MHVQSPKLGQMVILFPLDIAINQELAKGTGESRSAACLWRRKHAQKFFIQNGALSMY